MFWMVCYDVTDDRRRQRVRAALQRHGERVQKSVFECHLNAREAEALQRELEPLIDRETDRIRFYALCVRDRNAIEVDGQGAGVTQDLGFRLV